jgi:hypothetical protein
MSPGVTLTPIDGAVAAVTKIGIEQLGQDAIHMSGYLIENATPTEKDVAIALIALRQITREKPLPRDVAHHVASFAQEFPEALSGAIQRAGEAIAGRYFDYHAGIDVIHAIKLLEICERWRPMLHACRGIEGESLS